MKSRDIQVYLGAEPYNIQSGMSLEAFLQQYRQGITTAYAVAVNKVFVPKSEYANTLLVAGDKVALVRPMQGG